MFEELSITFENPATDPMGHGEVSGRLTCLRDSLRLQFKQKDRAFRKHETRVVDFEYREIVKLEVESKWFRPARALLETRSMEKLEDFPGGEVGRIEMFLEKSSVDVARKMVGVIDFQRSEELLAESEDRMRRDPES